jgi:hypothetical protein
LVKLVGDDDVRVEGLDFVKVELELLEFGDE